MTVLDVDLSVVVEDDVERVNHYVCGVVYVGTAPGDSVESMCGRRFIRPPDRYSDTCQECIALLRSFSCPTFGVCPDDYRCWRTG